MEVKFRPYPKYRQYVFFLIRGALCLLPLSIVLTVMPVNAAWVCKMGESCAMIDRTYYWERVCKPTQQCNWVPDATPPPPPPPPAPPVPAPPAPPIKTVEEIEREAHVKFCKEFPAEITLAVERCENAAIGRYSMVLSTACSSGVYDFSFNIKDRATVSVSMGVSPSDCRATAEGAMMYARSSCKLSGNEYRHALAKNCQDVN
ncbi:hypothetical protein [Cellvibrio sp. UBA7671]|uniref:hypothetical protein n=1 Tax=Cellvibrio sp. UBA7671 TaxID=1946312 RepID=UPI002F35DF44